MRVYCIVRLQGMQTTGTNRVIHASLHRCHLRLSARSFFIYLFLLRTISTKGCELYTRALCGVCLRAVCRGVSSVKLYFCCCINVYACLWSSFSVPFLRNTRAQNIQIYRKIFIMIAKGLFENRCYATQIHKVREVTW